jgi:hypothetical protein
MIGGLFIFLIWWIGAKELCAHDHREKSVCAKNTNLASVVLASLFTIWIPVVFILVVDWPPLVLLVLNPGAASPATEAAVDATAAGRT